MNDQQLRARIKEHWRSFDAFAESQNGVNGAIIRALDVFQGARENFTAASSTQDKNRFEPQADAPVGHQFSTSLLFPKGDANTSDDRARTAYFRAEESLALAQEQLARSERTLGLMAEEVEGARQCIGSSYSMEKVRDREEREVKLAQPSRQALDRGEFGCLMSPVDMVRAMGALLRMHQNELEMQETIIDDIGYTTPGEVFTAYREALSLRPFMDDRFLSQVQEIRELSAELERSTPHAATGISSRT